MTSNSSENNTLARKRPGRTLREIIDAADEGVEAPSEVARKVLSPNLQTSKCKRKKTDTQSSSEAALSVVSPEIPPSSKAPQVEYVNGKLQVVKSSLSVYMEKEKVKARKAGREKAERWLEEETEKFYRALQIFGTDFSVIERLIPGRSRKQIKNKFNKEEKVNPERIDMVFKQAGSYTLEDFEKQYGKINGIPNGDNKFVEEKMGKIAHSSENDDKQITGDANKQIEYS